MSIESKIEALTTALNRVATALEQGSQSVPVVTAAATVPAAPVAAPVFAAPAPVAAAPVAVMPGLPSFAAPAPAAPILVPFTDGKGLIDYVMGAYRDLGAEKGAQIQTVLTGLGYQNINDVKTEHYPALHAGVEALRG